MTLLDAPKFDAARDRRNRIMLSTAGVGFLFVLIVVWWLVAGRPVDWPWNCGHIFAAGTTVNHFLTAVEKNDLSRPTASGSTTQLAAAPQQVRAYPFDRFQAGLEPDQRSTTSTAQSRATRLCWHGRPATACWLGILINGRKSKALNLDVRSQRRTRWTSRRRAWSSISGPS